MREETEIFWTCDEEKKTEAVREFMKMNVEGIGANKGPPSQSEVPPIFIF